MGCLDSSGMSAYTCNSISHQLAGDLPPTKWIQAIKGAGLSYFGIALLGACPFMSQIVAACLVKALQLNIMLARNFDLFLGFGFCADRTETVVCVEVGVHRTCNSTPIFFSVII